MRKTITDINKLDNDLINLITQSNSLIYALNMLSEKLYTIGSPDSITLDDFNELLAMADLIKTYAGKHANLTDKTYKLINYGDNKKEC